MLYWIRLLPTPLRYAHQKSKITSSEVIFAVMHDLGHLGGLSYVVRHYFDSFSCERGKRTSEFGTRDMLELEF